MNRHLAALALGLLGLFSAGAQAQQPLLRFVTEHFPPYTLLQAPGDQGAGPMAQLLLEACQLAGWRCEIKAYPWRRALRMAEQGEVDGIFTVVDTPERRQYFHLSLPVVQAQYSVFMRAGRPPLPGVTPVHLSGRSWGVYGPSGTQLALQDWLRDDKASITQEPDNLTVLKKLAAGRYGDDGLALVNEAVGRMLITEHQVPGLLIAGPVRRFSYHFGLTRSRFSEAELRTFDGALNTLCRGGRSAALMQAARLAAAPCDS